jgi:hypothetical protein
MTVVDQTSNQVDEHAESEGPLPVGAPVFDRSWLKIRFRSVELSQKEQLRIDFNHHMAPRRRVAGTAEALATLDSIEREMTNSWQTTPLDQLPPIRLWKTPEGTYRIVDGSLALMTRQLRTRAGENLVVELFEGTEEEAFACAAGIDQRHGRRRTDSERREAVYQWLVKHPDASTKWLATIWRLRQTRVEAIRSQVTKDLGIDEQPRRFAVGEDGLVRSTPYAALENAAGWLRAHPERIDEPLRKLATAAAVTKRTMGLAVDKVRREIANGEVRLPEPEAQAPGAPLAALAPAPLVVPAPEERAVSELLAEWVQFTTEVLDVVKQNPGWRSSVPAELAGAVQTTIHSLSRQLSAIG